MKHPSGLTQVDVEEKGHIKGDVMSTTTAWEKWLLNDEDDDNFEMYLCI